MDKAVVLIVWWSLTFDEAVDGNELDERLNDSNATLSVVGEGLPEEMLTREVTERLNELKRDSGGFTIIVLNVTDVVSNSRCSEDGCCRSRCKEVGRRCRKRLSGTDDEVVRW